MKILITTDWYAPTINGVVFSVLNLRRGLEARGHEVRILTLAPDTHSGYADGVTYIGSVNAGFIYPGARLRSTLAGKLIRDLIEWKPDVVHSNCEFSTFFLARKIAKASDAPLVHTYHTVYEDYTHYFFPVKKIGKKMVSGFSRWISQRTDAQIAPTGKVAELLKDYGVTVPIYVIPTGIDQERFAVSDDVQAKAAVRQRLNIPVDHVVPVYVGRLAKEKNCEELLYGVKRLVGVKNWTLLIVGGGSCQEELMQKARELKIEDRVVFTGMIPPEEVGIYYRAGDLFVNASTSEAQGLTYMEALSCGLPMLCRRDDCLKDVVIDGYNGWQYGSRKEFAEHLRQFMASPELQTRLREGAIETGRRYSIEAFAKSAERVYRKQIVRKRSQKP